MKFAKKAKIILISFNIFFMINLSYSLSKTNKISFTNKNQNSRASIKRENYQEAEDISPGKFHVGGLSISQNKPLINFLPLTKNTAYNINSPFLQILKPNNLLGNPYSLPFYNNMNPISNIPKFNLNNNKEYLNYDIVNNNNNIYLNKKENLQKSQEELYKDQENKEKKNNLFVKINKNQK